MSTQDQLMRVCSHCGQPKPLTAFLLISATQGTVYGTICAPCQSLVRKEKPKPARDEERTSTSSTLRIGAKQKLEINQKQKNIFYQLEQDHVEKIKKRDADAAKKEQKTTKIEHLEKQHRRNYIQPKESFLKTDKKSQAALHAENKRTATTNIQRTEHAKSERSKGHEAQEHKKQLTELNMTIPFVPYQMLERMKSPEFIRALELMGIGYLPLAPDIKRILTKNSMLQKQLQANTPSEPGAEYIEKNWNNPSKRR